MAKVVVCIARQFGSGGRAIGQQLAQKLEIPFYDKEILARAAEKSGILHELFERHDEVPLPSPSFGMQGIPKAASYAEYVGYTPGERIQSAIAQAVQEAAGEGSCVIIGRCADYTLRGQPGVVSVFVHAPLEVRTKRIQRQHNLDEEAARKLIRKTDRARENYYSLNTGRSWGAADNYDLVVNSARLGMKPTVDLLCGASKFFEETDIL